MITPVTEPEMSHEPASPFVYESEVPVGGAALQGMLVLATGANEACGAGSTVIILE